MMRLVVSIVFATLSIAGAKADGFGGFTGDPVGEYLMHKGHEHFRLFNQFDYKAPDGVEWNSPAEELSDGATIPGWAHDLVGKPFDPQNMFPALIHDYYCCSKGVDFDDTHWAFFTGVRAKGASRIKAWTMLSAIYVAGPRRWTVDDTVNPPSPCYWLGTDASHSDLSEEATVRVRKIMVSKVIAMVRTLNSTDGRVLDVVDGEPVLAERLAAQEHLTNLNTAVQQNFDFPLNLLGLFTIVEPDELASLSSVRSWEPAQIEAAAAFYAPVSPVLSAAGAPVAVESPFSPELQELPDSVVE